MKLFGNLKIWQKLFLTAALGAIPVVVLLFLFVRAKSVDIERGQNEVAGLEYLAPMRALLEHVPQHRGMTNGMLNGDASFRAPLQALGPKIDADLAAVEQVDKRLGAVWGTSEPFAKLKASWAELRQKSPAMQASESFNAHTRFISEVQNQIQLVGDKSGLILDTELDTYYLASTVLTNINWASEYLGQLSGYGAGIAAAGRSTAEEQAQTLFLISQVTTSTDRLAQNMNSAFAYSPVANSRLGGISSTAVNSANKIAKLSRERLLGKPDISAKEFLEAGSESIAQHLELYDKSIEVCRDLLNARVEALSSSRTTQLGAAALVLLLAFALVYGVRQSITRQVGSIQRLFGNIGVGNLQARAEVQSGDELGVMTQSLNQMLDNTLALIQSRDERDRIQQSILKLLDEVSGVAEGDLTKEAEVTAEMTGAIADSFNYMIVELRRIISQVQATTSELSGSAGVVRASAEELARQNHQQSAEILRASEAIGEMASSIQQVSVTAVSAAGVAEKALSTAREGSTSVNQTIDGMNSIRGQVQETSKRIKRLGESSQEIGEIIQLISDIADRTSILALNASIQAAMAGDSGKGFAVVAEEVERLAIRATDATKKVSTLVKSIQADTNEAIAAMEETTREVVGGSKLANEAGQRLSEIEQVSDQIANLVRSISDAARTQADSTVQVARGMSGISRNTEQTAQEARDAAVAIASLNDRANTLRQSLDHFRLPRQTATATVV